MFLSATTLFLLLVAMATTSISSLQDIKILEMIQSQVLQARNWVLNSVELHGTIRPTGLALRDCGKLYDESEYRLAHMLSGESNYTSRDALTWLSSVAANHRSCVDELSQIGFVNVQDVGQHLTTLLNEALVLYKNKKHHGKRKRVYAENVKIEKNMKNVMFVGDGIDKTIVTSNLNEIQGHHIESSATFDVVGDGFWARDMTFENTAGPQGKQAVALKVSSDLSIFYRCSFKGYQDTLYVHDNRQFFRDCHIYGTIDFIFGDAQVVFQNCDIFVRKPLDNQYNIITAQGRYLQNETSGISIQYCRVRPAPNFASVKHLFKTYLGRPWKNYSRTVFLKTHLGRFIHPQGWKEWDGKFALSTLYYGEYINTGKGASTARRVNWHGFHVLRSPSEASPFSVSRFIMENGGFRQAACHFQLKSKQTN
ncbi:Pectinesterase [Quillaja saponaria]|uniref:Pectinesterase n=1 Tax=Quillaja saponaria TaxID=32244 RepID=A0AAD7L3X7_QUISA|nr:Pectinesterase [Quillaja saponaria]